MNATNISRPAALALALVPGWGHVYLGHELRGLVLFTLGAISGFAALNARWIYLGEGRELLLTVSSLLFAGFFGYSLFDVVLRTRPARVERMRRLCDQLLWEGMMHFVRGDDDAAEEKFLECTRLDGLDVEACFRAGVVASRRGESVAARRLLRRAQRLDLDLKWRWEIRRELASLRSADEGASGQASGAGTQGGESSPQEKESSETSPAAGATR